MGAARNEEVRALKIANLEPLPLGNLVVHFEKGKTNQFHKRQSVSISRGVMEGSSINPT